MKNNNFLNLFVYKFLLYIWKIKKTVLIAIPFLLFMIEICSKKCFKKEKNIKSIFPKTAFEKQNFEKLKEELKKIDSQEYFREYVLNVIQNGSDKLNFPSGKMDGGFVNKSDAKRIVAYMEKLQGYKTAGKEKEIKEGAALFYGNCTGCHGIDGKGHKGHFPNINRKPLLGIELRKRELISILNHQ